MTVHSFTVADAKLYGVEKATILQNLRFWLEKNKANKTHIHDGYVWTYNSSKAFHELFPYLSPQKIARLLRDLEADGVIKSANYNKAGYDQTKWYTIIQDETFQCSNLNNGICKSEQPIPDSKPDIKTDNIKSSGNDYSHDVLNIYHETIDQQKPNWAKSRSITAKRKMLLNKALTTVRPRALQVGRNSFNYLANLLEAMAQDPFYSGTQPSRDKPNGYQWTIDQVLRADILAQAIDRLSGD